MNVPHLGHICSVVVVGYMMPPGSNQLSRDSRPVWTMCRRLADDLVWKECCLYARDLVRDTRVMITNDMPKALPRCGINVDSRPAF